MEMPLMIKYLLMLISQRPPSWKAKEYIHTWSGWSRGDKSEFPKQLIDELAGKRGYVVASMNYRLVKDTLNRFPAQMKMKN